MSMKRSAWGRTTFVAASLILSSGAALRASDAPVVHVKAVVKDGNVALEAQANAPFEYTTYRPSQSLLVLDLSGVSAGDSAGARVIPSELVKSYRVSTYTAGPKPVVRVEVLLRAGVEPKIARTGNDELSLTVSSNGNADGGATAAPASATTATPAPAAITPVAAKTSETKLSIPSSVQAIETVKLNQNGQQTEVNVVGSGKLNYKVTRLQNPDRIVLDFSGAHIKTAEKNIASNLDPVRDIRIAQFSPEVSRVVIDLRSPAHYAVNASGNNVTVAFTPAAAASTPAAATEQPSNVSTTKAIEPATSAPAIVPVAVVTKAPAAEVPAPAATLPATLTSSSTALATPLAVSTPAVATPAPAAATQQAGSRDGRPLLGRTDFRELERRGPPRLLPPDSRNQRLERCGRPRRYGQAHDRSRRCTLGSGAGHRAAQQRPR